MIMTKGAKRRKVVTSDGNFIDTIFFDRRQSTTEKGNTLVISCDGMCMRLLKPDIVYSFLSQVFLFLPGNCGFYEIGVLGTPVEAGYSVLGW